MSLIKKIGAMFMAGAMVLGLGATGAKAELATGDGSITIKSPILGASYDAYRIFDMTRTEDGSGVAYSISETSPFYTTVKAYADENEGSNGLVLTATTTTGVYNVSTVDGFEPQKFGQVLEAFVEGADEEDLADLKYEATYSDTTNKVVTVAETDEIKIENLPYGYYLVLGSYPTAEGKVTLSTPEGITPAQTWNFTKDSTDEEIAAAADEYTAAVIEKELADYLTEHAGDGTGEDGAFTDDDIADIRSQLETSIKANTIADIKAAIANQVAGDTSDINVQTQRLVFLDSTNKDVDIVEKNLLDTWDVPVNPVGSATLEGLPEHDEPEGGKNIIIGYLNGEPIYANETEANVGDTLTYELRVNAVNFVREDSVEDKPDAESEFDVKQIKEYVLADYQSDALTFAQNGTIVVHVVDADGNDVTKLVGEDGSVTAEPAGLDYTAWAEQFFIDGSDVTRDNTGKVTSVMDNGGGIVVPWAILTDDETVAAEYVNKTEFVGPSGEEDDPATEDVNEAEKKFYWCNIYDNDVTIVVTYQMTLNDKAVIDGDGNINYAQYGMNFTDDDQTEYNPDQPDNPPDEPTPKPDEERDVDNAVVNTYALAIQKIDEDGNKLAGAVFTIKGLTVKKVDDGYYKVESFDPESSAASAELVADDNGLLVIEGFSTSADLEVTEVTAPDGYNKLTTSVPMKATKIGEEVTTTATSTYYADEEKTTIISKEESTTRTVTTYYYDGQTVKATKVVTDGVAAYYDGEGNEISETAFNGLVGESTTNGEDNEVVSDTLTPYAVPVVNKSGTELPSTGGTGTKLFYAIGGILVAVAGVLLVSRKRMLN